MVRQSDSDLREMADFSFGWSLTQGIKILGEKLV